jgi:acetylornithine/N-succinyldiaminopimelate aminotransferase
MKTDEVVQLFDKYVIANYTRTRRVFVKGEGSYLWDADGEKYLDFFPGWAVNGIGHCHPKVVVALQKQAAKLIHVANNYYTEPQGILARHISENSFAGKCFFCNSGAEANEAAFKLARLHGNKEGKRTIVAMENSFHGRTLATITATGQPKYKKGFEPLPRGFVHVPFNDIKAVGEAVDEKTCAIIIEPIQGEGGIHVAGKTYLKKLRDLCDEKGILLIFDEVQTGMGRTGELFCYKHYDVVPDIMTLAKSLGGGVAIGAIAAKNEVAKDLVPGTHASTFGGNPLACSAAIAAFEAIEEEKLLDNAREMGKLASARLKEMKAKYGVIKEVRGMALMIGIQLDRAGKDIVERCLEKKLLINCTHETVIRMMPSIAVKKEELEEGLGIFEEVLSSQ